MKRSVKARGESSLIGEQTRGTAFLMRTQKKETSPSRKGGQEKPLWLPREARWKNIPLRDRWRHERKDEVEERRRLPCKE